MTLKESYLANLKNLPADSVKLNVTRSSGHLLSPSLDLLMLYKNQRVSWEVFTKLYKQELNKEACKEMMLRIKERSKEVDVYLLCFEKNGNCHRHILLELINKMG